MTQVTHREREMSERERERIADIFRTEVEWLRRTIREGTGNEAKGWEEFTVKVTLDEAEAIIAALDEGERVAGVAYRPARFLGWKFVQDYDPQRFDRRPATLILHDTPSSSEGLPSMDKVDAERFAKRMDLPARPDSEDGGEERLDLYPEEYDRETVETIHSWHRGEDEGDGEGGEPVAWITGVDEHKNPVIAWERPIVDPEFPVPLYRRTPEPTQAEGNVDTELADRLEKDARAMEGWIQTEQVPDGGGNRMVIRHLREAARRLRQSQGGESTKCECCDRPARYCGETHPYTPTDSHQSEPE